MEKIWYLREREQVCPASEDKPEILVLSFSGGAQRIPILQVDPGGGLTDLPALWDG